MRWFLLFRAGGFGIAATLILATHSLWGQKFPHVVETEPLTPNNKPSSVCHRDSKSNLWRRNHKSPSRSIWPLMRKGGCSLRTRWNTRFPPPMRGDAVTMLEIATAMEIRNRHPGRRKSNIPIGVVPTYRDLLVYSIPNTYLCRDTNKDGKFNDKKSLFGPWGIDDTHGMASSFTRWLDGWIYACHGFSNDVESGGQRRPSVKMNSGNTYRFRADGSHIEQFTHGQVNPSAWRFDPFGNSIRPTATPSRIYNAAARREWYPSFGKPHDGLGYGPEMIERISRLDRHRGRGVLRADQFPAQYLATRCSSATRVTGRINHDQLSSTGRATKRSNSPTSSCATIPGSGRLISSWARRRCSSPTSTTASSGITKCR